MNPPLSLPDLTDVEVEDMPEDTKVQLLKRAKVLNDRMDYILEKIKRRIGEKKSKK